LPSGTCDIVPAFTGRALFRVVKLPDLSKIEPGE
jgi:hypothetical protein